jgi:hypothetical protein
LRQSPSSRAGRAKVGRVSPQTAVADGQVRLVRQFRVRSPESQVKSILFSHRDTETQRHRGWRANVLMSRGCEAISIWAIWSIWSAICKLCRARAQLYSTISASASDGTQPVVPSYRTLYHLPEASLISTVTPAGISKRIFETSSGHKRAAALEAVSLFSPC